MEEPSTSNNTATAFRAAPQKRILPSRSRRGGPTVGNCDADVMILDTFKRQSENEPLIPRDTTFYLSTSQELVPPEASTSASVINARGYERYFEQPDVIKAYREQMIIETPEFHNTTDDTSVGSRFRPRLGEPQAADTSDETYETRHRKYEKFEKRIRLREKEKLQHEQYKLHERVEQLRVMDHSAFLALPASSFSPAPSGTSSAIVQEDAYAESSSSGFLNGNSVAEGERRRKEMLAVAESLEDRYRTLLPPERRWKKYLPGAAEAGDQDGVETAAISHTADDNGESEVDEKENGEYGVPIQKHSQPTSADPLKVKIKFVKQNPQSISDAPKRVRAPSKKSKKDQTTPKRAASTSEVIAAASSPMYPEIAVLERPEPDQDLPDDYDHLRTDPSYSNKPNKAPKRDASGKFKKRGRPSKADLAAAAAAAAAEEEAQVDELVATPPEPARPKKKRKKTTTVLGDVEDFTAPLNDVQMRDSPAFAESVSARRSASRAPSRARTPHPPPNRPYRPGTLVMQAQHDHAATLSGRPRKSRHLLAFGFKVPSDVSEMEMDYELPLWLLNEGVFQQRYSVWKDVEEDPRAAQKMHPSMTVDERWVNGQRTGSPDTEDSELVTALEANAGKKHGEESESEQSDQEDEEAEAEEGEEEQGAEEEEEEEAEQEEEEEEEEEAEQEEEEAEQEEAEEEEEEAEEQEELIDVDIEVDEAEARDDVEDAMNVDEEGGQPAAAGVPSEPESEDEAEMESAVELEESMPSDLGQEPEQRGVPEQVEPDREFEPAAAVEEEIASALTPPSGSPSLLPAEVEVEPTEGRERARTPTAPEREASLTPLPTPVALKTDEPEAREETEDGELFEEGESRESRNKEEDEFESAAAAAQSNSHSSSHSNPYHHPHPQSHSYSHTHSNSPSYSRSHSRSHSPSYSSRFHSRFSAPAPATVSPDEFEAAADASRAHHTHSGTGAPRTRKEMEATTSLGARLGARLISASWQDQDVEEGEEDELNLGDGDEGEQQHGLGFGAPGTFSSTSTTSTTTTTYRSRNRNWGRDRNSNGNGASYNDKRKRRKKYERDS